MKLIFSLTLAALGGLAAAAALAAPATAADCNAIAKASDRAICANPAAAKADADMRAAFDALIGHSTPADQKVFQNSQSAWLDDRHTDCDYADATEKPAKPAAAAKCVIDESNERGRFLSGQPDEGPGYPGIVPVMREGQGFLWSLHFADPKTPAEKLVNQAIDGNFATVHVGAIGADGSYIDPNDYSDNFDAELRYASPDIISIEVTADYLGKKPGESDEPFHYNLNVNMRTGEQLDYAEAFAPDVLPKLQKECRRQLAEYLQPAKGEAPKDVAARAKALDDAVFSFEEWSFGAKQVTLNMNPGDEDPYECHLPYTLLRKYLKPGFPLPS